MCPIAVFISFIITKNEFILVFIASLNTTICIYMYTWSCIWKLFLVSLCGRYCEVSKIFLLLCIILKSCIPLFKKKSVIFFLIILKKSMVANSIFNSVQFKHKQNCFCSLCIKHTSGGFRGGACAPPKICKAYVIQR
jgi:hypothetical protein